MILSSLQKKWTGTRMVRSLSGSSYLVSLIGLGLKQMNREKSLKLHCAKCVSLTCLRVLNTVLENFIHFACGIEN